MSRPSCFRSFLPGFDSVPASRDCDAAFGTISFFHPQVLQGLDESYIIPFRHIRLETPPIAAGGGCQIYRAQMHGAVVRSPGNKC